MNFNHLIRTHSPFYFSLPFFNIFTPPIPYSLLILLINVPFLLFVHTYDFSHICALYTHIYIHSYVCWWSHFSFSYIKLLPLIVVIVTTLLRTDYNFYANVAVLLVVSMTVLEIRFINYLMFVVLFLTKNQEHLIPNMISIFKRFRIKITIFHFPKFLKPFVFYLQKRENLKMMLLFDV